MNHEDFDNFCNKMPKEALEYDLYICQCCNFAKYTRNRFECCGCHSKICKTCHSKRCSDCKTYLCDICWVNKRPLCVCYAKWIQ